MYKCKRRLLLFFCVVTLIMVNKPIKALCQPSMEECVDSYRFNGEKIVLSEKEWKERLTPEQFKILRQGKTEAPFRNPLFNNERLGLYSCAGCELPLFSSKAKYDSKTGWPSFTQPICKENVSYREDNTLFSKRTEVHCSRCGGHLGHVFDDGPKPTGKRYCMNSGALKFYPEGDL